MEVVKLQRKLKRAERDHDIPDFIEHALSHTKLMKEAQKDLLAWQSSSTAWQSSSTLAEKRLVSPIPQLIPQWATVRKPLGGVYWMATAGSYLSNGQVRELSLAFRNKHITAAAVEWLRTPESGCRWRTLGDDKVDSFIPTVEEWWGELSTFFTSTAKAGSGAEFG